MHRPIAPYSPNILGEVFSEVRWPSATFACLTNLSPTVALLLPNVYAPVTWEGNTYFLAAFFASESEIREGRVSERLQLPRSYFIDESDPDVVVLRRQDGSFVAAFSADGATREGIVEAAKEDYQRLLGQTRAPEGPKVHQERLTKSEKGSREDEEHGPPAPSPRA
jgi:hypothetical protein